MTDTFHYIGLWGNSEWTLLLNNDSAEIYWKIKNCKATGNWALQNSILTLKYVMQNSSKAIEWRCEILERTENYIKIKNISNELGKIEILEKEKSISQLRKITKKHNDALAKAFIYSIFISVLFGSVIGFFINPEIPSWLVFLIIFIGSFIYAKYFEE